MSCALTFPAFSPAARRQRMFCWGQYGRIGATGIHKQRGQTKVSETEASGTLPNDTGGNAASTIWGPSANSPR